MAKTAGLQLQDLLILLRHYAELEGEEQLQESMESLVHAQTKKTETTKSKWTKDRKSKTSPPSHASMELDSDVTETKNMEKCVVDLVKISCHLNVETSADNPAEYSTRELVAFGSLLEILKWALTKVHIHCKDNVDILERVSEWVRHLLFDNNSTGLKNLLLSEGEVAKSVTTKILALYGFSNKGCSGVGRYEENCSKMSESHRFLNDVFLTLVDTAQSNEGNVLSHVLEKRQYREILQKLQKEGSKIAPSEMAVLLQELWLLADKPLCFMSMCNST